MNSRAVGLLLFLATLVHQALSRYAKIDVSSKVLTREITVSQEKHVYVKLSSASMAGLRSGTQTLYLTIESQFAGVDFTVLGESPANFEAEVKREKVIRGYADPHHDVLLSLTNSSPVWASLQESGKLYIRLRRREGSSSDAKIKVGTLLSDSALLSLNKRYKALVHGIQTLRIRVLATKTEGQHSLKFVFRGISPSSPGALSGFGLKGDKEPTPENRMFDMARFDTDLLGYVIDRHSPYYCESGTCTYSLAIKPSTYSWVEVYLAEYLDQEKITLDQRTIGQIEPVNGQTESHIYSLETTEGQDTTTFSLLPVEGVSELLVNPGFLPNDDSQFYYKTGLSAKGRRVFVSKRDLIGMGVKQTKIYLKVICHQACKYILKAREVGNKVLEFEPGFVEVADIDGKEVRQHLLAPHSFTADLIERKYRVSLLVTSGEANLHIKTCQQGHCHIDPKELNSAVQVEGLVSNKAKTPSKTIVYTLVCTKTLPPPTERKPDAHYSTSCGAVIAIEGITQNPVGKVFYELSVELDGDETSLGLGQYSYVRIPPGEERTYLLTLPFPQESSHATGVSIILDCRLGSVTYSLCPKVLGPNGCTHIGELSPESQGALKGFTSISFPYPKAPTFGYKTIAIKLKTSKDHPVVVILGAKEEGGPALSPLARDLPAGLMAQGQIGPGTQGLLYSVRLPQDANNLRISLVALRGQFIVAVKNDDTVPSITSATWTTASNDLVIPKEDPNFRPGAVYLVAVYPKTTSGTQLSDQSPYLFRIGWQSGDKHSQIDPGVPRIGSLGESRECFVAEISSGWSTFMIMKGGDESLDLFLTAGADERHTPSLEHHDFQISTQEYGAVYSRSDIQDKCKAQFGRGLPCNLYICMYGRREARYSLTLVAGLQPITLPHGAVVHGPAPIGDQEVHFVYHPKKDQAIDIEEFSSGAKLRLGGNLIDESEPHTYPDMKNYKNPEVMSEIIHVSHDIMAAYKNPLILLSVAKAVGTVSSPANTPNTNFNFSVSFGIEAGAELKELQLNEPRSGHLEPNQWAFYYFYNPEPLQPVLIGLDSLNHGMAEIFLSKGKDNRPTLFSHLARSFGYTSSFISLDNSLVRQFGYDDMRGFYVLGVMAYTSTHYSLYWRRPNTQLLYMSENIQREIQIPAGGSVTVGFMNYYPDDIELILDSLHQPLKVYWDVQSSASTSKSNDVENYPREGKSKVEWTISSFDSVRVLNVSNDTAGFCSYCRHFFTLRNERTREPISVRVRLSHRSSQGYFETLYPGTELFGAGLKDEFKKYRIYSSMSLFNNDPKGLGLEMHLLYGTARVRITKEFFSGNQDTEGEIVRTGYTKINLEGMVDGNNTQGILQHVKMLTATVGITCLENCAYRFQLVHPSVRAELGLNRPREAFIATADQIDTFVLPITGKEPRVEVSLSVEETTQINLGLSDAQLMSVLKVYHFKSKTEINDPTLRPSLKPIATHIDGRNGRLVIELEPVAGYLLVKVSGIPGIGFKYRLVISTQWFSSILPGRLTVNKLEDNVTSHTYEMLHEEPGSIFAKLSRCYGDVYLEAKDSSANSQFFPTNVDPTRFTKIWESTNQHSAIDIRITKANARGTDREFGYIDHQKNVSVYALEVLDSRVWGRIPFDRITPYDRDMFIDLQSSPPTVVFRPLTFPREGDYARLNYRLQYYVVLSKDPETLIYYLKCGKTYLSSVLKEGYNSSEVVQVIALPENIRLEYESTTLKPYHRAVLNVTSGEKYFMSIYAQVELFPVDSMPYLYTSNSLRIVYPVVDFEYRSYFYPIELMASSLGLLGLVIAVCCVTNAHFFTKIRNQVQKGFARLDGGQQEEVQAEVDADLEEYFMKIKLDYETEEEKRRRHKEAQRTSRRPDANGDHIDNSYEQVNTSQYESRESYPEASEILEDDEEEGRESTTERKADISTAQMENTREVELSEVRTDEQSADAGTEIAKTEAQLL